MMMNLEARIMRFEELTQWMCHKMGEMISETNMDEGVAA